MSKVLVNIHGAGKEMSDFYVEALDALAQIIGTKPACIPCWYADLSNIGAPVYGEDNTELPPEVIEFRRALRQQIREQRASIEATKPEASAEYGLLDDALRAADLIADVTGYIFNMDLQTKIKQRLHDVLEQATRDADETILVSHSLGTVVAFDVLREAAPRYKVSEFLTMGSPLYKLVRLGRRSSDVGAINPQTVRRWRNIYDDTDVVANAVGTAFPAYRIQDIFFEISGSAIPAHDYWRNEEVLKMIADALRA